MYADDKGTEIGPVYRNIHLGNTKPSIGKYIQSSPLTQVGSIKKLYL